MVIEYKCPTCNVEIEGPPTVDIGVGLIACGPMYCENCGWVEEYPDSFDDVTLFKGLEQDDT